MQTLFIIHQDYQADIIHIVAIKLQGGTTEKWMARLRKATHFAADSYISPLFSKREVLNIYI